MGQKKEAVTIKGTRYATDGTTTEVEVSSHEFLKSMRAAVGLDRDGMIETVFPKKEAGAQIMLVIDEHSRFKHDDGVPGYELNPKGNALYAPDDLECIFGPVVVFNRAEFLRFDEALG